MKKTPPSLQKVGILLTFIVLATMIIYSCKKDIRGTKQATVADPAVMEAKSWYEQAYPGNSGGILNTQATGDSIMDVSQHIKPDWTKAATYTRFDDDVVELPLDAQASEKYRVALKSDAAGDPGYDPAYSRTSFLLLKQLGTYKGYVMTIIADPSYLNNDLTKLDRNKYNKRDSDFSGAVLYSTPKGKFVSGWFYKQGVISGKIGYTSESPADSITGNRTAVQAVKTNKIIKVTTCKEWTQMSYNEGNAYGPYYLGTTCSTTYVDDGVPDNAGSTPTVPVGSSSGGGTPLYFPCTPTSPSAPNPSAAKTVVINGVKVSYVQPPPPIDGGGGMPPPSGSRPCPTYASLTMTASDMANAVPVDDRKVHIDPATFVKCFTDGKVAIKYSMTIYVTQPNPGKNDQWTTDLTYVLPGAVFVTPGGQLLNVGHTFVSFTKTNSDGTSVTQVMGFYPGGFTARSQGVIKDDSNHPYDVSYTTTVSASQFNNALSALQKDSGAGQQYILVSNVVGGIEYNCTDAAITWMRNAGANIPIATSRGLFINSPGDYGQALRSISGANTKPGQAPKSHGACN